jgi:DNA-directed RNA polymerase subunit K/omega
MTEPNKDDIELMDRSKYELVMIASREARRLNDTARASGKELKRRITEVAWERLLAGKIKFTYSDEEPPAEDVPLETLAEGGMPRLPLEDAAEIEPEDIESEEDEPEEGEPEEDDEPAVEVEKEEV